MPNDAAGKIAPAEYFSCSSGCFFVCICVCLIALIACSGGGTIWNAAWNTHHPLWCSHGSIGLAAPSWFVDREYVKLAIGHLLEIGAAWIAI